MKSRAIAIFAVLLVWVGVANAGKKKIVVLDFKGPDAEKFHDDVVKLIEEDSKIISTDKWNGAAEEADGAGKFNTEIVKKVAKKVKADGVVWGKVKKDGDSYTLELKLRAGKDGKTVGEKIEVTADSPKLKGKAKKKVKEDLIPAIDGLEPLGEVEGDKTASDVVPPPKEKDPPKETKEKDPPKETVAEGEGDDNGGKKKHKKHKKEVATEEGGSSEGGGGDVSASVDPTVPLTADEALLPQNRAVDFTIGMSFVARRLSFSYDSDLADTPSGYKQTIPVAGGVMDATVYPMAFSHKNRGIITGLGIEVMYDKVIRINSQKKYVDDMSNAQTANLATVEDRFNIGAVLRYPVSSSLLVGGKIQYSSQQFNIAQSYAGNMATDVPNVHYSMAEPKAFLKYMLGGPIMINVEGGLMLVTNTGGIQASDSTGYGPASVFGYELQGGIDYTLTKNLFVRALAKFETISLTFKGDPASLANTRDTDTDQDVKGAKDVYFGGMVTIGYAY
ncbi:MAG: hypothetical protein QM831_10685 [Kofleriaceae bacterium]